MRPQFCGFLPLVALLFTFAGLAGCGGGDSPPAPTATAAQVIAKITAEAQVTPTPDADVEPVVLAAFETWAANNGEPYRDAQVAITANDGYFATAQVLAWFRPAAAAPWEEREAKVECKRVGQAWQCAPDFSFSLTASELERRAATGMFVEPVTGMTFVRVPAGEFAMGATPAQLDALFALCQATYGDTCDRSWWDNAQPQHTVQLDEYWIGQTEVTNAQFQQFIAAGGYTTERYWSAAGWQWRNANAVTQPRCLADDNFNTPERPVVCMSWYEAEAFANWLTEAAGVAVRLPTEAEWEKAARGTDGRLFPWGDEFDGMLLNYCDVNCSKDWKDNAFDDSVGDQTALVGSYPAGAGPYGALDMAGNVWEWTGDWYAGEYRVVRGGSWYVELRNVAAVSRLGVPPDYHGNDSGFRVVRGVRVP